MATSWLKLIRQRVQGTCDDSCWEQYYAGIDRLVSKVYRYRYGNISASSASHRRQASGSDPKTERGNYNFNNGVLRVDLDSFTLCCWEKLVADGVERQILLSNVNSDSECEVYLFSAFSHLLQEMIEDLLPFFSSRRKQVSRALKQIADAVTCGRARCHRLKGMKSGAPASRRVLFDAAAKLPAPAPHFPRNPDATRGPMVPFDEMRDYLVRLFTAVGGTVAYTDLLDLIKLVYGLTPPQQVSPSHFSGYGEGEESIDDLMLIDMLTAGQSNVMPTVENFVMARDFFSKLSDWDCDIFYLRHCKGLGVEKTAEQLGCSTGTVSGAMKSIYSKLRLYLFENEVAPCFGEVEELNAVVAILEHLVAAKKEAP